MPTLMSEGNSGRDCAGLNGKWRAGPFEWELTERALVMGILNVTPDSFSDGGQFHSLEDTLAAARSLVEEGAELIDIGGESTRPGAESVSVDEELQRVVPVIEELLVREEVALSVDTCKPEVAQAALQAGVHIVNDVSGFRDPSMIDLCADSDCGLVVMHMQGTPRTMQKAPTYGNVVEEVRDFFEERFETLTKAGIEESRIIFDPGIGFGKSLEHNQALLKGVKDYKLRERPVLMGLSRKSFMGALLGDLSMERREAPTQALTALTRYQGAMVHRVHAVKENVQSLRMIEAVL